MAFHCDEPGSDGNRACTCEIQQFAPIQIAGIGFVCISAGDAQCEPGSLSCAGGSVADVTIVADGKIGTCTDNVDCASQCDSYCAGKNMHQIQSGCTGYCAGGDRDDMPCDCDLIPAQGCPADGLDCPDGQCNGPDPATAGTCQCQCVDTTSGEPGGPGTITCNLPTGIVVEKQAPCGDGDIAINVGSPCLPLTSAKISSVILNANNLTTAFPSACVGGANDGKKCSSAGNCPDGTCEAAPTVLTGVPEECSGLMTGKATSLQLRGAVNFFGSSLGDLISAQFTNCE